MESDFTGSITVKKGNIVLDGNNHTLFGPQAFTLLQGPPFIEGGICLERVSKVTVKNFVINGGPMGILVNGDSNIIVNNTIIHTTNGIYSLNYPTQAVGLIGAHNNVTGNYLCDNVVGVNLMGDTIFSTEGKASVCQNNVIAKNTVTNCSTALLIYTSEDNHIYHNSFVGNKKIVGDSGYIGKGMVSINVWDDGFRRGNFWDDYQTRYSNASEVGASGVGDTVYLIRPAAYIDPANLSIPESKEHWTNINAQYAQNVDHYPLMEPFSNVATAPEGFPTVAVAVLAVAAAAIGAGAVIYYRKHHVTGD